ncbi:hypothetical protein [Spirosoma sp.]|uniref:hypothetical protein n=1 Tax=Spirosoma sp. TaxID=1899569 RepID=UPI0026350BF1|nr:hypothetical protein [Spirosoma sp.]MCX6216412.1 hypothetical protein [Spirosoma sp.]
MKITDLITLTDFFEGIAKRTEGIDFFLPLSNGEKAIDEIESYYTNDYKGTTAFFQMAESGRKDNGAGLESLTFMCSMTVAQKPDGVGARAGLITRDRTQKLLLSMLGQIELAVEASIEELEDEGESYEFSVAPAERMFPIGQLANVNLEGHYIDIDVTIPANHLLYPA